jgi:hypothetical protein
LAELKGAAGLVPNESILIDTLSLQEAKDSSAIENIVTTHDDLYRTDALASQFTSLAARRSTATPARSAKDSPRFGDAPQCHYRTSALAWPQSTLRSKGKGAFSMPDTSFLASVKQLTECIPFER